MYIKKRAKICSMGVTQSDLKKRRYPLRYDWVKTGVWISCIRFSIPKLRYWLENGTFWHLYISLWWHICYMYVEHIIYAFHIKQQQMKNSNRLGLYELNNIGFWGVGVSILCVLKGVGVYISWTIKSLFARWLLHFFLCLYWHCIYLALYTQSEKSEGQICCNSYFNH